MKVTNDMYLYKNIIHEDKNLNFSWLFLNLFYLICYTFYYQIINV